MKAGCELRKHFCYGHIDNCVDTLRIKMRKAQEFIRLKYACIKTAIWNQRPSSTERYSNVACGMRTNLTEADVHDM